MLVALNLAEHRFIGGIRGCLGLFALLKNVPSYRIYYKFKFKLSSRDLISKVVESRPD